MTCEMIWIRDHFVETENRRLASEVKSAFSYINEATRLCFERSAACSSEHKYWRKGSSFTLLIFILSLVVGALDPRCFWVIQISCIADLSQVQRNCLFESAGAVSFEIHIYKRRLYWHHASHNSTSRSQSTRLSSRNLLPTWTKPLQFGSR